MTPEMRRYLNGPRRYFEIFMALAALYFGTGLLSDFAGDNDPLYWMYEWSRAEHLGFAMAIFGAAVIHGIGIRWNGRGGWKSPMLRVMSMVLLAGLFCVMAFAGSGTSAFRTYSVFTFLYAYSAYSAAQDFYLAWKGHAYA